MTNLLCPDCGHDVDWHIDSGCRCLGEQRWMFCKCKLSESESLRSAQRAAAIAHLRAIGKEALEERECQEFFDDKSEAYMWRVSRVIDAIAAYRAVGILKERKP